VTRKGESVAELYARCEAFLRAFIARVEGRRPPASASASTCGLPAVAVAPSTPSVDAAPAPAARAGQGGHGHPHTHPHPGVGVGHERILLVSHAGTTIALARALTGDAALERGMRVGCCTLTTLQRAPCPPPALAPAAGASDAEGSLATQLQLEPQLPSLAAARDVIGRGVWTVRGTPADGSFLAGGVERSWGLADVETREGVVVEDAGVPGSEDEEDGPNGVQAWWQTEVPCPKM